jgi:hypothetical protein
VTGFIRSSDARLVPVFRVTSHRNRGMSTCKRGLKKCRSLGIWDPTVDRKWARSIGMRRKQFWIVILRLDGSISGGRRTYRSAGKWDED